MTHLSFGTNFESLQQLATDIWVMLYVNPFKVSNSFLLFLMFSLIFMNMQIRYFLYHTIVLSKINENRCKQTVASLP